MLDLWHGSLAHADHRAIYLIATTNAIRSLNMGNHPKAPECSPSIIGTMQNKLMKTQSQVELQPGTVMHSHATEMNLPSLRGTRYFGNFIVEESSHVKAVHMGTNSEAAELQRRHLRQVERQTGTLVKKIVLDSGKWYLQAL